MDNRAGKSFDLDNIMEGVFVESVGCTKQVGTTTMLDVKYNPERPAKGPELERRLKRTIFKSLHLDSKTKAKQLPSTKGLVGNTPHRLWSPRGQVSSHGRRACQGHTS